MLCLVFPTRISDQIKAARKDSRYDFNKASNRPRAIATLLSRPMPLELVDIETFEEWKVVFDSADIVSTMQTKILGASLSSAIVVASFMYQQLFEERVDAWTQVIFNRTIT